MITCTLGEKKYSVNMITGRALREIGPAADMYTKLTSLAQSASEGKEMRDAGVTVSEALDVMVQWFCILFNNQFTPDEFYDNYPADRTVSDLALAILAVQNQATRVLESFPTTPAAMTKTPKKTTAR